MDRRSETQRLRVRIVATSVAAVMTVQSACSPWRAVPLTQYDLPAQNVPGPNEERPIIRVHLEGRAQWINMEVRRVNGPFLEGVRATGNPPAPTRTEMSVDTRRVRDVHVHSATTAGWRTAGIAAAVAAGADVGVATAVGVVMLITALATKTSCPFVYVDTPEGTRFVGEAYSGSVVRPLQRDDLLLLPTMRPGTARVTLSNHAHETQHTDRVELWLVEHPASARAVAGFDGRPIVVGEARPPAAVRSLTGAPLTPPSSDTGRWWESDMEALAATRNPPLRDGIEVTFAAPADRATPVLELDASNTHWLDLVLGRMFASFGDGLGEHLARADSQRSDAAQRAWRDREAIDLSVETILDGRWQRVAVVPTPGPAALRSLAVPLPRSASNAPLRVRLSAGTGFWRIGSLALSELRDASPTVTRLAPSRAEQPDGSDARALVASTDGVYQHLPRRGERLLLEFEPPPAREGLSRSAFLSANGYYTVHAQPQAQRSAGTLLRLRDEAGSMARFSFDLYRELYRVIREAPVRPMNLE